MLEIQAPLPASPLTVDPLQPLARSPADPTAMAATEPGSQPRPTKKRRADPPAPTTSTTAGQPTKKKSPLFNLPQNKYAPPSASTMSKEEVSEWRKEQRRRRNRESAAISRGKSKLKQQRLEGERDLYRRRCQEMEAKMKEMEARIRQLEELAASRPPASDPAMTETGPSMTAMTVVGKVEHSAAIIMPDEATSAPAVSIVPSIVPSSDSSDLFPALLSVAPMSAPRAEPRDAVEEHIMISRPAVVVR